MSIKSKIITSTYPIWRKILKLTGMGITIFENKGKKSAAENFYSLKATLNNGEEISFERYKNKKVLIVNLASQCGYTPQYEQLQELYEEAKNLVILGFPANNFGGQEPGTDEEIQSFCKVNYGVTFALFQKADVVGENKQPVYQWLTNKSKNGWNEAEPQWNFFKYLVDENGNLKGVYSSAVSPFEIEI